MSSWCVLATVYRLYMAELNLQIVLTTGLGELAQANADCMDVGLFGPRPEAPVRIQ